MQELGGQEVLPAHTQDSRSPPHTHTPHSGTRDEPVAPLGRAPGGPLGREEALWLEKGLEPVKEAVRVGPV